MLGKSLFALSTTALLWVSALAAAPVEADVYRSYGSYPYRSSRSIIVPSVDPFFRGSSFSVPLGTRRYVHSEQQRQLRQPNPYSYEHYRSGRTDTDSTRRIPSRFQFNNRYWN